MEEPNTTQQSREARFLLQKRKLGKENESSRTPRWACLIDAFLEKSLAKNSVEERPLGFSFLGWFGSGGCRPLHGACALRTHPYTSVHFRTSTLYTRRGFSFLKSRNCFYRYDKNDSVKSF